MAQQIESKAPITDAAIDQVIKANEAIDENSEITQGGQLRRLVKDLRDRLETEITINSEKLVNKVDAEAGKGLSTLDFTQADKESIENFNNWSDDIVSKDYVEGKIAPLRTNIDGLQDNMNGVVRLLDAPLGPIFNTQTVLGWNDLSYETQNGIQPYVLTIPSEFYDDADGRGTVRVKFFVKIFPKENGIVNLKVNLFGDGVRGFGFFTEAMTSSSTKEFHVEFLLTKGIGNTDRFVCINGIPSQDLHSWSDTGAVEVEWADFPTTVSRLKFSTSAGTQRADVSISGLTAEMCILND